MTFTHPASAVVGRRRLGHDLARVRGGSVVTIEGPAGFGKSTLTMWWAQQTEIPIALVVLSPQYDDVASLGRAVLESLIRSFPDDATELHEWASGSLDVQRHLVPNLLRWFAHHRVLFVLDDVHLLSDPSSLEFVQMLVSHMPAPSILALIGRRLPPIKFARAGVQGRWLHLGADDLELTVEDLVTDETMSLTQTQAREVIASAGGWPAGIQLSLATRLSAPGANSAGRTAMPTTVGQYISDEVLGPLTSAQRRFLAEVAVVGAQTTAVLDHVREADDSAGLIEQFHLRPVPMVRSGLTQQPWIGVHAVLAARLHDELAILDPGARGRLLRRLADFLESNGQLPAAFDALMTLGDHERATDFVSQHGIQLLLSGEFALPVQWLRRLAADPRGLSPSLQLMRASVPAMEGKTDSSAAWYELLAADFFNEAGFREDPEFAARLAAAFDAVQLSRPFEFEIPPLHRSDPWWLAPEIMRTSRMAYVGELRKSADLLTALELHSAPYALAEIWRSGQLAWVVRELGEPDRANDAVRAAEASWSSLHLDRNASTCQFQTMLAWAALDEGDRDRARIHLNGARAKASELQGGIVQERLLAALIMARLAHELGDAALAGDLMIEAGSLAPECADAPYLLQVLAETHRRLAAHRAPPTGVLSAAELRVLSYLASYYTVPQIAGLLHVSPSTVRSQSQSIYRKLKVNNRAEAVAIARDQGFLH